MSASENAKTDTIALGNTIDARDGVLYNLETRVLKLVKLIRTQLICKPAVIEVNNCA